MGRSIAQPFANLEAEMMDKAFHLEKSIPTVALESDNGIVTLTDGQLTTERFAAAPDDVGGLSYIYIVESNDTRRMDLHAAMSKRTNAVVRTYNGAVDFAKVWKDVEAGCVILSGLQFDTEALEVLTQLHIEPRFAVVVVTRDADLRLGIAAMKRGATDFLCWPLKRNELHNAVNEALGKVRQLLSISAATTRAQQRIARLSTREREVLGGLIEGKSNKMIALELHISPRTIEIYRAHLMEKLGVRSLSEVLKIAFAAGVNFTSAS